MSKRFVVVVLDSFGIGAMDDVGIVRPQDLNSNTALHLLEYPYSKKWTNLIQLGLLNAMDYENDEFKKATNAIYGKSKLKHFGADSYFGHQEISGTNPKKPDFTKFLYHIDDIEKDLIQQGYHVERITKNQLQILKVNNMICIGDNMETDLGQAINVVGALDDCGFELIDKIGHIVREHVKVPRVIAFGGSNVTIQDIENNIITKDDFIGVDAPGSGVYKKNYQVIHIGYGVDKTKQVPIALDKVEIKNYFYGKVENIVYNPNGINYPCVDTYQTLTKLIEDIDLYEEGFFFLNIQETDLAGHGENPERYIDVLNIADERIGVLMSKLSEEDILIVMADHGNDPTIGHSKHTREYVPILVFRKNNHQQIDLNTLETMADIGQTVADYFGTSIEYGTSFLNKIKSEN